jgi:hypothetical protein
VAVAVEKRGRTTTGRARMAVIPEFRKETLLGFLNDNVAPGSTVSTWQRLAARHGLEASLFQPSKALPSVGRRATI